MRKKSASESGIFNPRLLIGCALVGVSALLAALSFAADPAEGTITPTSAAAVTWAGTAPGTPPAAGGEADCVEGENCDTFKLTISGTPEDWTAAGKQVFVQIKWAAPASDYDLYIHKGAPDGPVVANSGDAATTTEQVPLNPASASVGTGDFYVRAVYFAVAPGDQYTGEATLIDAPPPATRPIPAPQASGVEPRYQNHTPPPAGPATLGIDAAEPSIGVNWKTEGVLDGPGDDLNGGRAMYIAMTQTLRVTFDDTCVSSPTALWEDKSFPTTEAITFDPILFTDHGTGRTLVSQLLFPAGTVTTASAWTDTDGDVWGESTGAAPGSGIDHQTIGGGGPFHAPVPPGVIPGVTYPNAVYYCAQLPTSSCGLSVDGGITYGPAVPAYPPGECGGLHGHIKVGPDGTAYLPNKSCGTAGEQAVVVSEDNGVTWQVRSVPGSFTGESDAAVYIGRGDKTEGKGRVYLGYADGDTKAVVAVSDDQGKTWGTPVDVGAKFGINNVAFPTVVAGDDDRAAMAFYGTPTQGGLQGPKFNGIWHLYVAQTYDGGKTWHTVDATPNDPMQRGCIWLQGGSNICRNMLDFMGIDVDKRGRVLVAYNDGCAGAECAQAPPTATGNSYTALAVIARQTGGKGLFAAEDAMFPDAPTAPGDPYVTGLRNGNSVRLQWSLSNNGGSPVTQYNILRGTQPGQEAILATVPGTQLNYVDSTATDSSATYYYKVTAVNAQGVSCGNYAVPVRYVGDSHSPEGYTVHDDPAADQKTPTDTDLDIRKLSIAEPGAGEHAGKLVFKLKLSSGPTGNNRMWRIIWDSPNAPAGNFYVGATRDADGAMSYEYGTVATQVIGLVLGLPTTTKVGDADFGSFSDDGLLTIVISPDKVASPGRGDLLGNFAIRTYNTVKNEIRSTDAIDDALNSTANDLTANAATYQLVGPAGAKLLNISTRARVQTGENALIGGFIVNGSGPKKVLIRGMGPSLTGQNVAGVLEDPVLELNNSSGISSVIATNDNWKDSQQADIAATGIPPSNDAEAAIVQTLAPGAYTAVLRGKGDSTGVGLVEVYDISGADSELANLSSRGLVETEDNVMIGGLIVGPAGIGNSRIIVRAVGPSLSQSGITGSLQDPMLELYDGNGAQLAANDNWKDSQQADIAATQIPPVDDREAAILATVAPGNYTAIVRGKEDSTGVALVEAYNLR